VRVLITGGNGQLGRDLYDLLSGRVPDGGRASEVGDANDILGPVAAGSVDILSTDIDTMDIVGTNTVRAHGAHLVYVSTDYVFDGTLDRPYVEWDEPRPQSVYGRSKLGGEREVTTVAGGSATIVRTAWVNGMHGANMVKTILRLASADPKSTLWFVDDQQGCPTFTADLAKAIVRLAFDRRPGTFHVTNGGETTWFGFAQATLAAAGMDPGRVEPIATADLDPPRPAPRPANSRLDNAALRLSGLAVLPEWQESLSRLVRALAQGG
jgi:dTDP-4-dehydrorhamnose reductase